MTNGVYPPVTAANQDSSWYETSYVTGSFLDSIKSSGLINKIPVDPVNDSMHFYRYYLYGAGEYGCDASRGAYYILSFVRFQSKSGNGQGPGFSCSGRDWANEDAQWVAGGYTK